MEQDLKNSIKTVIALAVIASAGASSVGAIIDTKGFESLTYSISAGTIATGDFTVLLEEGEQSDLSDASAVPAELVIGAIAFAATDDNTIQRVGVVGKMRYQRLTLVGASTPDGDFSATGILGHPQTRPTGA